MVYHDDNEQENATWCIYTPHHGNRGQTTGFKLLVTRVSSISRQVEGITLALLITQGHFFFNSLTQWYSAYVFVEVNKMDHIHVL